MGLVEGIYLRPLPFESRGELITIQARNKRFDASHPYSFPAWEAFRQQARSLSGLGGYIAGGGIAQLPEGRVQVRAYRAEPDLFEVLGARPFMGRLLGPDDKDVALLGHAFWKEHYRSRRDALGQTLVIDGRPLEIIGVLRPDFLLPTNSKPDLWAPYSPPPEELTQHGLRTVHLNERGLSPIRGWTATGWPSGWASASAVSTCSSFLSKT